MISKKVHRYVGLLLLLPMLGWACTGLVFLLQPGYVGAYEILQLKTYPLEERLSIQADQDWEEFRLLKSAIGSHLLVKSKAASAHLDPVTMSPAPNPAPARLKLLFADTISHNAQRYGAIERVVGTTAFATTGVTVELDWDTLQFTQTGFDRELIDMLYKVHYLQWTPWPGVNQVLGTVGLILLVTLTVFGLRLYVAGRGIARDWQGNASGGNVEI